MDTRCWLGVFAGLFLGFGLGAGGTCMGNATWGVDDGWSGTSAHAGFWTFCTNAGSGDDCITTVTKNTFKQHGRYHVRY